MNAEERHTVPSVAVIVLNYNGKDILPGLLESLSENTCPNTRIFLVDNASKDGSVDNVESEWSDKLDLVLIRNTENLLFSAGNNVGIEQALEWGADYIFLLNNDTIVPPALISELVEFMETHPDTGIAGPMIHFGGSEGLIWGAGGKVSLTWGLVRHRGIRRKDSGQFDEPANVDYVSGAAMMIRRAVIGKIGMLDADFPMYFEDTDFCFRAANAGYGITYVPTNPLIHLVSVAAGGQVSSFKIKRRFAAGLKFFARYACWFHWPTIILGQIYEVFRVILLVAFGKTK